MLVDLLCDFLDKEVLVQVRAETGTAIAHLTSSGLVCDLVTSLSAVWPKLRRMNGVLELYTRFREAFSAHLEHLGLLTPGRWRAWIIEIFHQIAHAADARMKRAPHLEDTHYYLISTTKIRGEFVRH